MYIAAIGKSSRNDATRGPTKRLCRQRNRAKRNRDPHHGRPHFPARAHQLYPGI